MIELKLHLPQAHATPKAIAQKFGIARLYVELTRELCSVASPGRRLDLETLLTMLCVFINDVEHRPATATKISAHSGLSRPSVYRHLTKLRRIGAIVRIGNDYRVAKDAVRLEGVGKIVRLLRNFQNQ